MPLKRWLSAIWAGAALILFHRLLFGEVLFWGLPSLQFYPWHKLAVDQILAGHIPYWNPYNGAGSPLMANYQTAILYPPNWLYVLFDSPYVMTVLAIGHLWWTALGMWRLTEQLGLTVFGRGVSVLSFSLSAYVLNRVGSFPTAYAIAWLPWLFYMALVVWESRRWRDVGILGLIFGMQILTGHGQTTFYSLVALGLFMLWRIGRRLKVDKFRETTAKTGLLVVSGILGIGLASWQLLLTAELLGESQRSGGVDFADLANISLAPFRILTFLMPHYFGTPANGSYSTPGQGIYFEEVAYIGFIPLIAAVYAMHGWIMRRKKPSRYPAWQDNPFWLGLGLLGIVLALGRFAPYYEFLYEHVPTFDNFREPVRWLLLTSFSFSILAGVGIENWLPSPRRIYWTRLANAGAFATILISLVVRVGVTDKDIQVLAESTFILGLQILAVGWLSLYKWQGLSALQLRTWQAVIWLLIALDLAWASFGMNPSVSPKVYQPETAQTGSGRTYWQADYEDETKFETYFNLSDYTIASRNWQELRDSELPNLNILNQSELYNTFDPLHIGHYAVYLELIEEQGSASSPLLAAAAVDTVYGETVPNGWTADSESNSATISTLPPHAWLVSEIQWVSNENDATTALTNPSWNPYETVVLIGDGYIEQLPAGVVMTVELKEEDALRREYRVQADVPAVLVMSYTHYPGWTATLNGQEVDLLHANLTFQAIEIPAGTSEIVVEYKANNEGLGIGLMLISLVIILGLIFSEDIQRMLRRKQK